VPTPVESFCVCVLDPFDIHVLSELSKCRDVLLVRSQHCATGFGQRNNQRINGRPSVSQPAQQSCPPRCGFGNFLDDVASLEERVGQCIARGVTLQAFYEHDGWNQRRPQILLTQCSDQPQRLSRPLCKATHRA
jgi:hypothetical protein